MPLEGPPVKRLEVSIFTDQFQFSGELEVTGQPLRFINDTRRQSLSLHNAQLQPLTPGVPLNGFSVDSVVVRRHQIIALYFHSDEVRSSIRTLRRTELLVAYTPVCVCRARFHMADEANINDFLEDTRASLMPITEAKIFPLTEFPAPFPMEPDLLLIGKDHLQCYHKT